MPDYLVWLTDLAGHEAILPLPRRVPLDWYDSEQDDVALFFPNNTGINTKDSSLLGEPGDRIPEGLPAIVSCFRDRLQAGEGTTAERCLAEVHGAIRRIDAVAE